MYLSTMQQRETRQKIFIVATEQPFKGLRYSKRYYVPGYLMRWEAKHYIRRVLGGAVHRDYSYLIHLGWREVA